MQRNRKQIEELKARMLDLLAHGLTRKDIQTVMLEKHGVSSRTFDRYWTAIMKQEEEKLFKRKSDLLVGYIRRHEQKRREASSKFTKTKSIEWWKALEKSETDFMRLMATIGALTVKPQELEITLKTRVLNAIDSGRKELEKNANPRPETN